MHCRSGIDAPGIRLSSSERANESVSQSVTLVVSSIYQCIHRSSGSFDRHEPRRAVPSRRGGGGAPADGNGDKQRRAETEESLIMRAHVPTIVFRVFYSLR